MINAWVHIATLQRAHGIKGWLWVHSQTDVRADVFSLPWYAYLNGNYVPVLVKDFRPQGVGLVALLDICPDRTAAEQLFGVKIYCRAEDFPNLGDDEIYWQDLVGLVVINEDGAVLGQIKGLFETPAHAIMEVMPTVDSVDTVSRLIPWHDSVVRAIDDGVVRVAWGADY